ncbi:MAG: ABC transporter substrate-binding protein [Propionibacteriaceae bacterium]|nr:ABC transporter substrate-binding protein [Propionibacteriaceae bacterium]
MKLRRLIPTLLTVGALSLAMTACGGGNTDEETPTPTVTYPEPTGPLFTIGVAMYVEHPALQAVQDGFEEVLKEQGINYSVVRESAAADSNNVATIASLFAANSDMDLMLAIATPMALGIQGAETQRPILFSAVTDPVQVGLVPSWEQAGVNITGTSDLNPEAKPVELVTQAMPAVKNIGVLYSTSEPNSAIQVEAYKAEAAALGVELTVRGINSPNEIVTGLEALAGTEAILIPTDNTIVEAIASVVAFGEEKKIPVFCADNSTVELGTVATRGLSYYDLGRRTGEMAVEILRDGKPVSEIAPEATTETALIVNLKAAERFGITLPDGLVAQAVEKITE